MKRGRIIAAFIIGLIWFLIIQYAKNNAGALSALVIQPHIIFLFLALVFNAVGIYYGAGWPAIVAGSLYAVGIALILPMGWPLIIPGLSAVLCFAAMKREPPASAGAPENFHSAPTDRGHKAAQKIKIAPDTFVPGGGLGKALGIIAVVLAVMVGVAIIYPFFAK